MISFLKLADLDESGNDAYADDDGNGEPLCERCGKYPARKGLRFCRKCLARCKCGRPLKSYTGRCEDCQAKDWPRGSKKS